MGVCHVLVLILRFAISSAKEFVSLYLGILKFFTTFEQNEFSSSATFMPWVKIMSSSTDIAFSFI